MLDRVRGNLVKFHPMHWFAFQLAGQGMGQMPRDGLTLAVRVRGQPNRIGQFRHFFQLFDRLLLVHRDDIRRLKVFVGVHAQAVFGQVANMPD